MKKLVSLFLISVLFCGSTAIAQGNRFLTVRGEQEVEVPPDFVRLVALITANDDHVDDAKENVDSRTKSVVAAIDLFGIASDDLTFSGVEVRRNYKFDRNDNEKLAGYAVSRTVEIQLRELADYEQLVHALVESGIDELQDVQSDVDDKSVLERAALEGAAREAKLKAEAIASGLDIRLGVPIEIGENGLTPSLRLRQRHEYDNEIEEIIVTANERGIADPMLFVPENIRVRGVVWVRFEIAEE